MENLHKMMKHFSSASPNIKNYDSALDENRCLPTNRLEKDYNGIRIVDVHRLLKSSLRLNTGTHAYCTNFSMLPFL